MSKFLFQRMSAFRERQISVIFYDLQLALSSKGTAHSIIPFTIANNFVTLQRMEIYEALLINYILIVHLKYVYAMPTSI